MASTTRTQIPREVNNWYDQVLLRRAVPLHVHGRWAQTRDIPANSGTNVIKFRRYSALAAATTPLTEGITPVGSQMSSTEITSTAQQYGDFITVTDVLTFESPDSILTEASEMLGEQAGLTLDHLCRDIIAAGTNVRYANGKLSRVTVASTDLINTTDLKKVIRTLKNNKSRRITRMLSATPGIATEPVAACWIAIVHPDTTYTLTDLSGFVPIEKYSQQATLMEGEVGKYKEIRFIESTEAKVFTGAGAAGIDVYATLVFGQEAYGQTRISGQTMANIIKPQGSSGTADPLNQRATSGWKATYVAHILNNDWIVRLEHAAAA